MATLLIPGVGLVDGSGTTLLIPGAGLVEFASEATEATGLLVSAAWCWFQSPSVLRLSDGSVIVGNHAKYSSGYYQHVAHYRRGVLLSNTKIGVYDYRDDHNQPALYELSDHRILATYTHHGGVGGSIETGSQGRISTNPLDPTSWGSEIELPIGPAGYGIQAYASPIKLGSQLWLFSRRYKSSAPTRNEWILAPITEACALDGSRRFIWVGENAQATHPYVRFAGNGARIDFFCTPKHPTADAPGNFKLYHHYFDGAEWRDSAGAVVTQSGLHGPYAPANYADATLVWEDGGAENSGWVNDVGYDEAGNPIVLFQVDQGMTHADYRLHYGRWTGASWVTSQIAVLGKKLGSQIEYCGNASFDRENSRRIYLAAEVAGKLEVQEYRTADYVTWAKHRDITTGSTYDNARPFGSGGFVAWMGNGTYTTYTNFATSIVPQVLPVACAAKMRGNALVSIP